MLQRHLLEHTAEGPSGLFPGDRTDHMSVRYLMDRYRLDRDRSLTLTQRQLPSRMVGVCVRLTEPVDRQRDFFSGSQF